MIKALLCGVALALPLLAAAEPAEPGVPELAFRDFYRLPIGPRGLEPSARLLGLDGQRVRVAGYLARRSDAPADVVILAPVPVVMEDEDEAQADDLPAAAVFVHGPAACLPAYRPGPLTVTGRLQLGAQAEADGRLSMVRLLLDPAACRSHKTSP